MLWEDCNLLVASYVL